MTQPNPTWKLTAAFSTADDRDKCLLVTEYHSAQITLVPTEPSETKED